MNKQEFNFKKIKHMQERKIVLAIDCSNYVDGWDDCIRDLEKVLDMKLEDILKIRKGE